MKQWELFSILDRVDSTNNYAMAQLHAGLAKHGNAWFANDQHAGKGQRGKQWQSAPGENIILSIVIKPGKVFSGRPFYFNAFIAVCCNDFLKKYAGNKLFIKWPNDIFWNDRKAGGILVENIYQDKKWKWAVVGLGINVNQVEFDPMLQNPVSLQQINGKEYNTVEIDRELYNYILDQFEPLTVSSLPGIMEKYNANLYMRDKMVRLRKTNVVFETCISHVDNEGQLVTKDALERSFSFGQVEWLN